MKFGDIANRLSEKQKQRLREAKTNEDLDSLFTAEKLELTEDQLDSVAGGSCFLGDRCHICWEDMVFCTCPKCPICGESVKPGLKYCTACSAEL